MRGIKYGLTFAAGAFVYTGLEILWRGHTHISMSIAGGTCAAMIYALDGALSRISVLAKGVFAALGITVIELLTGVTVNMWLGLDVWDYSAVKYNLLGQICLPYTLLWYLLSIPAFYMSRFIRNHVDV